MAYTEKTSVSWFNRLGASLRGIGTGIMVIIAGTMLLWWNEGDFVGTGDALREAQAITQELGDISRLDSSRNGQLVHASGPVATKDMLNDPVFGLSVNAIRLERTVEFYQWVEESKSETRKKLGGGEETVTTYTYAARWTPRPVDSSQFRDPKARKDHGNSVLVPMEDFRAQAANVTFGAYRLPGFMISSISGAEPLTVVLSEEVQANLNKQTASAGPATQMVHVGGGTVFLGASPATPRIGDVRAAFKETRPGQVSFLARLNGDTFEQYRAANGKMISRFSMGTHSLENMYGDAHSANVTMTWILRVVGTLLVVVGLNMIVAPLSVLASVIPLLGSIVGAGAGIVSGLLGLAWSLVVISIAWLRFRPLIGGAMLAVAGALIALLYVKGRARKAANAHAAASQGGSRLQRSPRT
jgi:hypothetical protein